jgi:hypothetical protein
LPSHLHKHAWFIALAPLLEVFLLVCFITLVASFAIIHFESPVEQAQNEKYIAFMSRIKAEANLSKTDFDTLTSLIGIDPSAGTNNFVGRDDQADTWVPGGQYAFQRTFFYCFTIITTVGYGDFSVVTPEGKVAGLILAMVGIPLVIVSYTMFTHKIFSIVMHFVLQNSGEVRAAFEKFDLDGTGVLDPEELQSAFKELNVMLSIDEIDLFIESRDENSDGTLNLHEFSEALVKFNIDISGLARDRFKVGFAVAALTVWVLIFVFYICSMDGLTFLDGLWFVVITFTTIGLGDIVPSNSSRLGSMFFIFFGLGFMAMIIDALAGLAMGVVEKQRRLKEMEQKQALTKNIHALTEEREEKRVAYEYEKKAKAKEDRVHMQMHKFQKSKKSSSRRKKATTRRIENMKLSDEFENNSCDSDSAEEKCSNDSETVSEWNGHVDQVMDAVVERLFADSEVLPSETIVKALNGVFVNRKLAALHSLKFPELITVKTAKTYIRCYCLQTSLEDALNWQKATSTPSHEEPNLLKPQHNTPNNQSMETSPAEKMEEGMQKQDWGTFKYVSTDESGSDDDELRGYISTVDFISFELK